MARRRYQNGSVFLRGKREQVWIGRWREDIISGDGSVARVRRSEVLGTRKQLTMKLAMRELAKRVADINQPDYRGTRVESFDRFVTFWEANVLSQSKPSTQYTVKSQLKNHLTPFFGKMLLKDITWQTVQQFVQGKAAAFSPKYCKNLILTLQMIWKSARAGGYVKHDPFDGLKLPKNGISKPFVYTADEAGRLIKNAEGQFKTLYWVAAETGARPGELCALRVEDVDVEALTISIRQSAWRGIITTPKTANAIRTIAISQELGAHLRELLATWQANAEGLLFVSTTDGPMHPSTVLRAHLRPLCKKLGIQALGLKAFRHCSATMMDQARVPFTVMQERLGHAKGSKVTYQHYTHAVTEDARTAASTLGGMLVQ